MTNRSVLLRLMMIGCLLAAGGFASTITNPSFEFGPGGQVGFTGQYYGGGSAATGWLIWNNESVSTNTELCTAASCPSGALTPPTPADGTYDIHITTRGVDNGIYQIFSAFSTTSVGVYLNIVSGSVDIVAIGSDASYYVGNFTSTGLATLNFGSSPIDEIAIYGVGNIDGASNFYADAVTLGGEQPGGVPEPTTLLLGLGGLLTVVGAARRRRSQA